MTAEKGVQTLWLERRRATWTNLPMSQVIGVHSFYDLPELSDDFITKKDKREQDEKALREYPTDRHEIRSRAERRQTV